MKKEWLKTSLTWEKRQNCRFWKPKEFPKRSTQRHIVIKRSKVKERILKTAREKQLVTYKRKQKFCSVQSDSCNPMDYTGQNTGVDSLLYQLFLNQQSNCGLLHCRQILYQLRYQGSQKLQHIRNNIIKCILCAILSCSVMSDSLRPHQAPLSMRILQARILKWVAIPSSRGSSYPRDQTQVSLIAGRLFTV